MPSLQNLLDELGPKVSRAKERAKKEGPKYDHHEAARAAALAPDGRRSTALPVKASQQSRAAGDDTPAYSSGADKKAAPVLSAVPDNPTPPDDSPGTDTKTAPVSLSAPVKQAVPDKPAPPDVLSAPVDMTATVKLSAPGESPAPAHLTAPDKLSARDDLSGTDKPTGPDEKPPPDNSSARQPAERSENAPRLRNPPDQSSAPVFSSAPATATPSRSGPFDFKNLPPVGEAPDWSAAWTHTQFFNPLIEWLADPKSDVSLREMRLLLCIARQTWGFHRQWVELNRADIARITGYDQDNANRATKRLLELGVLLRQQEPGKKNRFALPVAVPPRRNAGADEQPGTDKKQGRAPDQLAGGSPRQSDGADDSLIANGGSDLGAQAKPLKKISKESLKEISLDLPAAWRTFVSDQPREERERVIQTYWALREQYEADLGILDEAPKYAKQWGVPDGKPIRNLAGLLAKYWPQVRDFWLPKLKQVRTEVAHQKQSAEADNQQARENERMQRAFAELYSDAEDQREILKQYAGTTFDVTAPVGRMTVIGLWWDKIGQQLAVEKGI